MILTPADPHALAHAALAALLSQRRVTVMHNIKARPAGWPLPHKRNAADPLGNVSQEYRALAILEWVDYTLNRPAEQPEPAPLPVLKLPPLLPPLAPLPKLGGLPPLPKL